MVYARWRQICTPPNTCFLGPTRVQIPNGISIGSTVFAGLTTVTDHATRSVTIGRIYVRSTAMRPSNWYWSKRDDALRLGMVWIRCGSFHSRSSWLIEWWCVSAFCIASPVLCKRGQWTATVDTVIPLAHTCHN